MSEPVFKFANADSNFVVRTWPDGKSESHTVEAAEYKAWVAKGKTPLPFIEPEAPPPPTVAEQLAKFVGGLTLEELKRALDEIG